MGGCGGLYTNLRKIEDVSPRKALAQLLGIQEEQLPTSGPTLFIKDGAEA